MILTAFLEQQLRMKLKIHNTNLHISYTLICLCAICLVTNTFNGFVICLMAVLIHEMGHLIPIAIFGDFPNTIKISLFEIAISDDCRNCRMFFQNIIIIFFGPFANFICFITFYLLYLFCNDIFLSFSMVNLFLGIFNMLPVLSLDGGQILHLLLSRKIEDIKAQKAVNILTFIFIFPLAVLGFILLFKTKYNFSLLAVCLYLILSLIFKRDNFD